MMKKNKLYILGVGPGDKELVVPAVEKIIAQSDVIIGGKRNLERYTHLSKEKWMVGNNLEEICRIIRMNLENKRICVLASGDPGIFSIMEYLKKNLKDIELEIVPGISALQVLCAKLSLSWHDMFITSLHGRDQNDFISQVKRHWKVGIFTGGTCSPQGICEWLVNNHLEEVRVTVGENLSYPNERIVTGKPCEMMKMDFDSLSIMILENDFLAVEVQKCWDYATEGIPDSLFIRGEVPMTKEEVRALTLSKLRLKEEHIVYDIGAGTGSVSVECGLKCSKGAVYAIEREEDATSLIHQNIQKFGLKNVHVVPGAAPMALQGLPCPDRVFLGGTGGNLEGILSWLTSLKKPLRLVANAIAIESVYEIITGFEKAGLTEVDVTSVSISKGRLTGGKHMMQALNSIYIISGEYGGRP